MKLFLFSVFCFPVFVVAGLAGFICFSLFGLMMWLENKVMKTNTMREALYELLVEFSSKVLLYKSIGIPVRNDTQRN